MISALLLATLFVDPVSIKPGLRLLMLLPLALSISLVYKGIRVASVRDMFWNVPKLWITIVLGMFGVGLALWIAFKILV